MKLLLSITITLFLEYMTSQTVEKKNSNPHRKGYSFKNINYSKIESSVYCFA